MACIRPVSSVGLSSNNSHGLLGARLCPPTRTVVFSVIYLHLLIASSSLALNNAMLDLSPLPRTARLSHEVVANAAIRIYHSCVASDPGKLCPSCYPFHALSVLTIPDTTQALGCWQALQL